MNSTVTNRERGVLVLANEVEPSPVLVETVSAAAEGGARVLVVAPATRTQLRCPTSEPGHAEAVARGRLFALLDGLDRAGVAAEGIIGDPDPARAAADALAVFPADEMIVASGAAVAGRARRLVPRLQERFLGPILELPVLTPTEARGSSRVMAA